MSTKSSGAIEPSILVTGATGLIGRWLLASLTKRGRVVAALVRGAAQRETELRAFVERLGGDPAKLVLVEGDVELADLGLGKQLRSVRVVYHLAARFAFGLSIEDARRTNVDGTQHVLDWASSLPSLERFVFLGGYRMSKHDPRTLEATTRPQLYAHGAYEGSKLESYALFMKHARARSMPWTVVHPSGLIGDSRTGETTQLVGIGETVQRLFAGQLPALAGSSRTWVPIVTVDYLADFLATVPERVASVGKELVVLDATTPPLTELVAKLGAHLGVPSPRHTLPLGLVGALPSAWTGLHPETLSFLSEDRYDTAEADAHAKAMGLAHPPIDDALARWSEYLVSTRFLAAPRAEVGRLVAGTFTIGDPTTADVVLLHGIPFDAEAMAPLASVLEGTTARIDLPGLGRSAPGAIDTRWLDRVLGERARPVVLVGQSLGAGLVARYAAEHPEKVRALVLVAPSFLMKAPSWMLRLRPLVARVLAGLDAPRFERRFLSSGAPSEAAVSASVALARKGVAARHARALAEAGASSSRAATLAAFRSLRVPVQIVHGDTEQLVQDVPNAEVVCVRDAGHNLHLTHTSDVAAAVSRFTRTSRGTQRRGTDLPIRAGANG